MIHKDSKSEQRRFHFSRQALRKALLDMMVDAPIESLAVTELCRRADINRSTFYLYYVDIYDLFNSILADFQQDMEHALANFSEYKPSVELLTRAFEVLNNNQDLCQVMLGKYSNEAQTYQIAFSLRRKDMIAWKATFQNAQDSTLALMQAFAVGAQLNLLKHWVANGFKETPIQLAKIASELLMNGFGSILESETDQENKRNTGA